MASCPEYSRGGAWAPADLALRCRYTCSMSPRDHAAATGARPPSPAGPVITAMAAGVRDHVWEIVNLLGT